MADGIYQLFETVAGEYRRPCSSHGRPLKDSKSLSTLSLKQQNFSWKRAWSLSLPKDSDTTALKNSLEIDESFVDKMTILISASLDTTIIP